MSTTYSKNSFDRFDDDLCEFVLSYLPSKDKFKYECVCSQWQRTIYQRVNRLAIRSNDELTRILFSFCAIRCGALERFLKKCPNISQFYMEASSYLFCNNKIHITSCEGTIDISELVFKYCRHLTSIDNSLFCIKELTARKLLEVYGPQLKSIVCFNFENFKKIDCNQFKNISRLNIFYLDHIGVLLLDESNPSDFAIKGLTHLKISCGDSDDKSVGTVIRNNKRLECLQISYYDCRSADVVGVLTEITKLYLLRHLTFDLCTLDSTEKVLQLFKELGDSCLNLHKLIFISTQAKNVGGPSLAISLLNLMQYFPNLTHLELTFNNSNVYHPDINESEITVQSFKKCPNLRHLKLSLNGLNDSFFTDIDKFVPNLCYLSIHESNTSEAIVDSIVRLKALQTFVIENILNYLDPIISPSKVDFIFRNCPRIKSVHIRYGRNNLYSCDRGYLYNLVKQLGDFVTPTKEVFLSL